MADATGGPDIDDHDAFESAIIYANSAGAHSSGNQGCFRMRLRTYEAPDGHRPQAVHHRVGKLDGPRTVGARGFAHSDSWMELTRDDSGARRTVRMGERVEVVLDEVPTSGYRWEPDVDASMLRVVSRAFDPGTQPGGSGRAVFAFEPVQPGPARLRFTLLKRPWEREPIDEFVADLDVTPT